MRVVDWIDVMIIQRPREDHVPDHLTSRAAIAGAIVCAVLMIVVAIAWWRSYCEPYMESLSAVPPNDLSGSVRSRNGLRDVTWPQRHDVAGGYGLYGYKLYYCQAMSVIGGVGVLCTEAALRSRGRKLMESCQRLENGQGDRLP